MSYRTQVRDEIEGLKMRLAFMSLLDGWRRYGRDASRRVPTRIRIIRSSKQASNGFDILLIVEAPVHRD